MKKPRETVRIEILNWDKYQRPLRGKGGASSRRSWVAISTDLCRSNDYLMLDLLHRNVWVMLLCHAGVAGPVFDLCPTNARRMFDLPRTPDFSLLANQGLIKIGVVTKTKKCRLHNKTRHNKNKQKETPDKSDEVCQVFDHWKTVLNHPRAKLDDKRKKKIQDRLKDHPVADLQKAVDGCKASDFHMGDNDKGQIHDGINLIFRDTDHVERFMGYANRTTTPQIGAATIGGGL